MTICEQGHDERFDLDLRGHVRRGRSPLRVALEVTLTAGALATLCHVGFGGLERYNAALRAQGVPFLRSETWVDAHIPFRAGWIWVYLSYYAGAFAPVLLLTSVERFRRVAAAYALLFAVAFACFFAWPMQMERPVVAGSSLAAEALRWLYAMDSSYHIFPSVHTANALLVALAFHRLRPGRASRAAWIWALAVAASTVLVKQHYVLDVVGGAALAWLADRVALRGGWLSERRAPPRPAPPCP